MTLWTIAHRCDPEARAIADRHYNRQSIGADNFVPPGRCLVLKRIRRRNRAFWVTSWPFAEYVRHAWPGAWVCSAFRREDGGPDASDLIRSAIAATRWRYPQTPAVPWPMVTFVNREKVEAKADPGACFLRAGFVVIGETAGGLVALGMTADVMPPPEAPRGTQVDLFG